MTSEQVSTLTEMLLAKGISAQEIAIIINTLNQGNNAYIDPTQQFISNILSNPTVEKLAITLIEQKAKTIELENIGDAKFHKFLSNINIWQKVYSLLLMVVGAISVYILGSNNVIGRETAQALMTLIITLTVTDAISSYLKSAKHED